MLHFPSSFPADLLTCIAPSHLLQQDPPSCCANLHGALSPASAGPSSCLANFHDALSPASQDAALPPKWPPSCSADYRSTLSPAVNDAKLPPQASQLRSQLPWCPLTCFGAWEARPRPGPQLHLRWHRLARAPPSSGGSSQGLWAAWPELCRLCSGVHNPALAHYGAARCGLAVASSDSVQQTQIWNQHDTPQQYRRNCPLSMSPTPTMAPGDSIAAL